MKLSLWTAMIGLWIACVIGCAVVPGSGVRGVAIDDARIFVVDGQRGWSLQRGELGSRGARGGAPLALPCGAPRDVEVHGGALWLLCDDGRVFSAALADLGAWRERAAAPAEGVPTGLQRSDRTLYRVLRFDPPPRPGISLDGPEPQYSAEALIGPGGAAASGFSGDRWQAFGGDQVVTTSEAGDAFLFTGRLWRRVDVVLRTAERGGLRCLQRGDDVTWDAAIDPAGAAFAILGDVELLVVEVDARGRARVRAVDPRSGARRRTRARCRR